MKSSSSDWNMCVCLCRDKMRFQISKQCYCFKTKIESNQASRPLEPMRDTKNPFYDSDSAMEDNFAKEMPFAIPEEWRSFVKCPPFLLYVCLVSIDFV